MERGLLWLPLLLVFGGLAWAGWNEYQKIEAYRRWAANFDQAKYDIYSALAQKGKLITWGKPTRKGPIALQEISLDEVAQIELWIDDRLVELTAPPSNGSPALVLMAAGRSQPIKIPFTEIPMAIQWVQYLRSLKDNVPISETMDS
jgi:hypothetical protein